MSELRQALGDDAGDPRFIKTVARRGYRFVAAVEPVAPPEEPSIAEPAGAAADDLRSIAVLDFTNVSGDPESAWLSAGIAGDRQRRPARARASSKSSTAGA